MFMNQKTQYSKDVVSPQIDLQILKIVLIKIPIDFLVENKILILKCTWKVKH